MDANFRSLGLSSMAPVKRSSEEFKVLETYARDTHGATHSHMKINVTNAYRVERYHHMLGGPDIASQPLLTGPLKRRRGPRPGTPKTWPKATDCFYGTDRGAPILQVCSAFPCRIDAKFLAGILKQGLRIAPPEGKYRFVRCENITDCLYSSCDRVRFSFFFNSSRRFTEFDH